MRQSKERNKNWNEFTGEVGYRSNFALQFATPITLKYYINNRFERFRFHIKSYLIGSIILWLFTGIILWRRINFIRILVACISIIFSWKFLIMKRWRLIGRCSFLLSEICFQRELLINVYDNSMVTYLLLFNIPTFIIDVLTIYMWYYHLLISLFFFIINSSILSFQPIMFQMWKLIIILAYTVVFCFIERIFKEDWVLYDSFKRTQNLYNNILNKFHSPLFIVNNSGEIVYNNESGKLLCSIGKKYKLNKQTDVKLNSFSIPKDERGILEIIHPEHKKIMRDALKDISKERINSFDVPIYTNSNKKLTESKFKFGLDVEIINNGIIIINKT